MAGARTFIGTKLFSALTQITAQITAELDTLNANPDAADLIAAWRLFEQIVSQIRILGRGSSHGQIDRAFNLLYLTSGVLYHQIARYHEATPKHDERFSHVEQLDELLSLCAWDSETAKGDGKSLLEQLNNVLGDCLAKLRIG